MGRKKIDRSDKVIQTFESSKPLIDRLKTTAQVRGTTVSALIRYILEHYIKEKDILTYVTYMLGEDIKTIEMYAEEIAELVLTVNKDKVNSTFEELTKMFIEEIESKPTFEEQVKFIASVINYLNNKECKS